MKQIATLVLAAALLLSCMTAVFAENKAATILYVALDGADTNVGSAAAPFATVKAAVEAARKIDGTVVINLREGAYPAEELQLGAQDHDLVIRAFPGETVSVNGSVSIPFEDFQTVTDETVLKRLVDKKAASVLKAVDLKQYGITDFGGLKIQGFLGSDEAGYGTMLSYRDKFLNIAQYPNGSEYLYTGTILDDGTGKETVRGSLLEIQYQIADSQRYKKWGNADDIWVLAFVRHDWADATVPAKVDVATGTVSSYTQSGYYPVSDRRVKFLNLLEEIDSPGEWYVDHASGTLYLYAPEGIKAGETLSFTSYEKPFITMENSKNIAIEGIRFSGTRAMGIVAKQCKNVVINHCELTNIGDCAVWFEKCTDSGVKNSYLHDLGSWGVYLEACGDKATLTPGNCFVTNCEIRTYSQYRKTYCPAVHLHEDVGNTVSHNEIHDAPHFAIRFDSNDDVIEYNDFYDVCKETADSGAVYTGRYWNTWGNKINYNYFHDLLIMDTTTSFGMHAIYLDDMHSQTDIFGNIFYNVDSVALMGGGRNNSFINNIMINCNNPLTFDARGTTWMSLDSITSNTDQVDWHTPVWKEKYPALANLMEDEPQLPKYNVLKNNILFNTPEFDLAQAVTQYGEVKDNVTTTDKKLFRDFAKQDFTPVETASVFKKLPEFETIPFDEIGRYDDPYVDLYPDEAAPAEKTVLTLTIGDTVIYANGAPVYTMDVPAQVVNDRTLVPLRAISESFGCKVDWDEEAQLVTVTRGDLVITLTIGDTVVYANGAPVYTMDVPAQVVNDRTLVPLRAISESFGCKVDWTEDTQLVTITLH